jgi:hypothetical protein
MPPKAVRVTKSASNAERIWPILTAAAAAGSLPTYEEVAAKLGRKKTLWLISSLDAIQNYCLANKLPPLTSIVVNKGTRRPSEGYLGASGNVEGDWKSVWNHDWTGHNPDAAVLEPYRSKTKRRDWTDPEVTMAVHLYLNRGSAVFPPDTELRRLANVLGRSEGSVGLKVANIQSVDPGYTSQGKKGMQKKGPLDKAVFEAWRERPAELAERFRELVAEFTDAAWEEVPTEQVSPAFTWTKATAANAVAATRGLVDPGRKATFGRDPVKQRQFAKGVHGALWEAGGPSPMLECPGCGHSRGMANGLPLLDACHIVDWKTTGSFDHRWGIPLCPNCHRLTVAGTVEEQKRIFRNATKRLPHIVANLRSLRHEGQLNGDMLTRIKTLGIRL